MDLVEIFAINVKNKRRELNISQEELADICGLHRTYISLIERKKRNITIKNIEIIAKGLNTKPYQLLMKENEFDTRRRE
ncbi:MULTISPECIES: helix-turn-helix domain-containing protein [Enterococcus]|uniref:helix-turn-helix domain-containing protein n=1 Tax=Enterococcus TaxID=1350 RepID=UPI0039A5AA93